MPIPDTEWLVTPLTVTELRQRLSSHVYTSYMNYSFLIKGGIYTIAGLSFFHILTMENVRFRLDLVIFWLASFSFSLVTVAKWGRGSALTNARADAMDLVAPIGLAIPEYLMFIVLDPDFAKQTPWTYWYIVFAAHEVFAFLLIWNRVKHTIPERDYVQELRPLARIYIGWMKAGLLSTAAAAAVSAVFFVATTQYVVALGLTFFALPGAEYFHEIIGVVIAILGLRITWQSYSEYNEILNFRPPNTLTAA